ncbi:histidine kinase [Sphingobacterium sp. lm-10]|uniref:sensor histidine kinase n=1 Tax=Sphingobacterium sp. lm-10 TaxID=2944904 RepID=UPI0020210933|nr:histidine kinase [Sphingobacterium sp. lm-10]MCL7987069.1 histidine kinase [Sphingobacterium sp. lm-10]
MRSFFFILFISFLFACQEHTTTYTAGKSDVKTHIQQLETAGITPQNYDSLKSVWHQLYQDPTLSSDSVSYAKVTYHLARMYGMRGEDSASFFVKKALDFIEPTQGNLDEKALVYNGMGNILSLQSKAHEAGFYYNQAAAIVLSDSLVDLSAEAKSVMLLSAAQSNNATYQLSLAERMIREAIPICDSLPAGHISHQRVLVQMIQTQRARKQPADSIAPYLRKLEELHRQHPTQYNPAYLYESKVFYFEKTSQTDSLVHYQLLKMQLDEERNNVSAAHPTDVKNLFLDYCNVASTYLLLGNTNLAGTYLLKAAKLKKEHSEMILKHDEIYYQKAVATLCEKTGRKDEAIALLNHTMDLEEDIYQEQNTQAVAEMNALYQLQAKDRSIQTLHENIQINTLQLQQNRLWLIICLLTLGLLALGIFLLYYSQQQRRIRMEKEKVVLQQQLLRTQMEPHFIFNTLSALQSFIRLDQKDRAIKYLNRFSRLLRSSLELSREQLVPLDEEVETLENYLSLQQMRFDQAFTYQVSIPEDQDLTAIMVPPMLVQPFVENAILHGINMETGNGHITIAFTIEAEVLKVTISDSGKKIIPGIKPDHRSLSSTISRERLQLLGKKAKLKSITDAKRGTVIFLNIPIKG